MENQTAQCELSGSVSFFMDGFVSLVCGPSFRKPVKIWRDSGAVQPLILQDVILFWDISALGYNSIVKGFGGVTCLCL